MAVVETEQPAMLGQNKWWLIPSMTFQYWKHHDNDKWYWLGASTKGQVLSKGGPHDTPIDVLMEILENEFYTVGSTITYRDKPGN